MRRANRVRWIVIAANVLTVLVAVTTNVATSVLPESWRPYLWLAWPVLIVLVLAGIRLVVVEYWASDGHGEAAPSEPPPSSRADMIAHVREIWVDGVLANNLYRRTVIELGLEKRPDMLRRPWDVLLETPSEAPRRLEVTTTVRDVAERHRGLLILGAPGAGKTTMLLGLLEELLARADADLGRPIPVVFPLAGWAASGKPLTEWLVDELSGLYGVPREVAAHWVRRDQILPLLDGLDEVALDRRLACAKAIDAFHAENRLRPLIVTSRLTDYDALGLRLSLGAALTVQPLTRVQLEDYLDWFGEPLAGLRAALDRDPTLPELLQTPFLLSVAVRTYEGLPAADVGTGESLADRRSRLLTGFVDRALTRKPGQARVAPADAVRWLAFVARALGRRLETMFFPEFVSVLWLPPRSRRLVTVVTGVLSGALIGAMAGMIVALIFGAWAGAVVGVAGGVIWSAKLGTTNHPSPPSYWGGLQIRVRGAVLAIDIWDIITVGVLGAVAGLVTGTVVSLISGGPVLAGLTTGATGGALLALPLAIEEMNLREHWPSLKEVGVGADLRSCVQLACAVAVLFGGPPTAVLTVVFGGPGLLAGALVTATTGCLCGGRALLNYSLTRVVLARAGVAPTRYVPFFEIAVARMLLNKVGDGWMFTHRLLLEYFAGLDLPGLKESYRRKSLPSIDLRPENLLADTLADVRKNRLNYNEWIDRLDYNVWIGRLDYAFSRLAYTRSEMSTDVWAPQTMKIVFEMEAKLPPARQMASGLSYRLSEVSTVINAYDLLVASHHAPLSAAAALRIGEIVTTYLSEAPAALRFAPGNSWLLKARNALRTVTTATCTADAAKASALLARLEGHDPDVDRATAL
ncbi:NACHT domain-containing protein [Acrocarpospora macrocephala]|uniref:NACHT domain-containing protein n=1 Tax=Acrocarpospora macrocephala TaxID=150177 RepID=UPI0012D335DF|nr:NACHT domain-containing protein [Acrocarpospora macrocephala]